MTGNRPTYDPVRLIARYLSGEATGEETLSLRKWMAKDPQHRELFEQYRKLWEKTGDISFYMKTDTQAEWKKLENRLNRAKPKTTVLSAERNVRTLVFRVAAVLIIAVLTGFAIRYFVNNSGNVSYTADTGVQEYSLPDGSTVTLNTGSTLSCSKKFNKDNRSVTLTGEAYFDVSHNKNLPFAVHAAGIKVTVLGTAFTVDARHPDTGISVVVDRGKVSMADTKQHAEVILTPGEEGVWNTQTRQLAEHTVSDPNYLAWKTRHIVFDNFPLSRGLRILEEVYHVQFKLGDKAAGPCHITATFDNEPLDSVLDVLTGILDLTWEQKENTYILTGKGCQH